MTARQSPRPLDVLIGAAAVAFSAVYFASDVLELVHGGFSTTQLAFTYVAEAAIPLFVLGLYAVQRPGVSHLGLLAAVTYAYTFVFFTSTVVYALVEHTSDWAALQDRFGPWITVHSVLMVVSGVAFGWAVVQAGVLPRWTGLTLIAGMVLMTATSSLADPLPTIAAGVRDVAFAAMGLAVLRGSTATLAPDEDGAVGRGMPAPASPPR